MKAEILAAGGLTASLLGFIGGYTGSMALLGAANLVMLVANLAVILPGMVSGRMRNKTQT